MQPSAERYSVSRPRCATAARTALPATATSRMRPGGSPFLGRSQVLPSAEQNTTRLSATATMRRLPACRSSFRRGMGLTRFFQVTPSADS